ncbi:MULTISPECIES: arsenate reductase ArsC [unclassified Pseudoxanthomonas]|jgi:arsenate reductase|uniref:arsenate reductase ArsC n=1 Tax=unclassified Pseudoxanthomonas TaxID=2645906 RepID=UPI003077E009
MKDHYNLLFVCTGNAGRSIIAEALANQLSKGRLRAYSAGSQPKGEVNADAIAVLQSAGFSTDGLRSKSWEEFSAADAPKMDLIITVCDRAANEPCPIWPGHPTTAHWSVPDPSVVADSSQPGSSEKIQAAYQDVMKLLSQRITLLLSLKLEALDQLTASTRLRESGLSAHAGS